MNIAWRITGFVFLGLLFLMIIKFVFPVLTALASLLIALFGHLTTVLLAL